MGFQKGKHAFIGIMNCEMCNKEITVYTSVQRFCKDCKKVHINEWHLNRLKNKENKIIHLKKCEDWRKRNPERHRLHSKRWREKNPEKSYAHNLSKDIFLEPYCEICGTDEKLERHHWRYDKPTLISTLCKICHNIQHIKHFNKSIYAGVIE